MSVELMATASSVGEILGGNNRFVTAEYQRPYSWTTAEIGVLVEECLAEVDNASHGVSERGILFLNTIVLIRLPPVAGSRDARYEIVDGLQRLVSLTTLLATLRDLADEAGEREQAERLSRHIMMHAPHGRRAPEEEFRVSMRAEDDPVFRSFVAEPGATRREADAAELTAPQALLMSNREYLRNELGELAAERRQALAEFILSRCQMVVIYTDQIDQAYRIFLAVNRPGKPLSRNDILKAELLAAVPERERAVYVNSWRELEQRIGDEFDPFYSHLRVALGRNRASIIAELRLIVREYGGARAFLENALFPMADVYAAMLGRATAGIQLTPRARQILQYLSWLGHRDWTPATLLFLFLHRNDPDAIEDFLVRVDRLAYGQLMLCHGGDKRRLRYSRLLEVARSRTLPIDDRSFALSSDDRSNMLYNVRNNFFRRSSPSCKLILLRLNDMYANTRLGVEPVAVTIEHVLPQNIPRKSDWITRFPADERARWATSLGNLILVSPETNASARNDEFEAKRALYAQDVWLPRMPLNRSVVEGSTWGPQDVEKRERDMLAAISRIWGLDED